MASLPSTASPADYATLLRSFVGQTVPQAEQWRTIFGRSTNLVRIASAITQAEDGYMRDIADLGSETISADPHLASVLGKRLGGLAAAGWELSPAEADDIDTDLARFIADAVRDQISGLPSFDQAIEDIAWGIWHGRSALEKHWERRPAERIPYHVTELGWIHPRRLSFGPERELRLVDGNVYPNNFEPIGFDLRTAPHKFITFRPRLFNEYPEREGLLPRCLYWSFFKRFSARERMILLELFGKPWRIVSVAEDSSADAQALDEAYEQADALGGSVTARLPKGIKLDVEWPDKQNGDLHNLTIEDCDRQVSKIVLGGTGTTDAQGGGLNDNTANVHADEEQHIKERDGMRVGERFRCDLVQSIVVVNAPWFGFRSLAEALRYVPKFKLKVQKPDDKLKELQAKRFVIDMGVAVPVDEIRATAGVRKPKPNEAIVQMVESPQDDMSARFVPPRPRVIDPEGTEPGQTIDKPPSEEDVYQPPAGAPQQKPIAPKPAPGTTPPTGPAAAPQETEAASAPRKPNPEDDDEWAYFYGPLRNPELAELTITEAANGLTNFPADGGNLRVSLRNSRFKVAPPSLADELKTHWPAIWKLGGGKLGAHIFTRLAPIARGNGVVQTDVDEEAVRLREAWAAAHVDDSDLAGVVAQLKWLVVGSQGLDRMMRVVAEEQARQKAKDGAVAPAIAAQGGPEAVTLPFAGYEDFDACVLDQKSKGHDDESAHSICGALQSKVESASVGLTVQLAKQPSTVHGSPESIMEKGLASGLGIFDDWATELSRAVEGHGTARDIRAAMRKAVERLDPTSLVKVVQERMVHAAMLGAMDAEWEAEHDTTIAPVTFAGQANFATKPFAQAISFFRSKKVVTPSVFERLLGAAKRAAFTIAGLAKKEMLQVGFDEVGKAIEQGVDLRKFRKSLNARFDSAGWTQLNHSHVETVFRNATMGAYSSGRKAQMTQPHVLKARPYWHIQGVNDDRTRQAHKNAHGKVLRANDPFWKRAPNPWGHACRCRVVSRSDKDLKRLGLEVVDGSTLKDLPDPGWDSSISLLV